MCVYYQDIYFLSYKCLQFLSIVSISVMSGWLKEDAKNQCLSQNKSNFACRVDNVDLVIFL